MVTGEAGVNVPAAEVVAKLTDSRMPALPELPKASSSVIVIVPDATPAVMLCGPVLNTAEWPPPPSRFPAGARSDRSRPR